MTEFGDPTGRYHPRRVLGEGGAGKVWLVEDAGRAGAWVALKEAGGDGDERVRHEQALRREFANLATLRHPGVVEVHEFHDLPDLAPRFTLEFVRGGDLVESVRREGPPLLSRVLIEALRTLAFLHDFGIVHRDLKPANLLVREHERLGFRLVLVDFGLALLGEDEAAEAYRARGTLPYLAPELFEGGRADARSDLYALGVVAHEAIFGEPPFVPGDDLAAFAAAVRSAPRALPPIPPGFDPRLAPLLASLLDPDPTRRPASASVALDALGAPRETAMTRAARLASGPPPGRELETRRLGAWVDPAPGPRVAWITGRSGSGKSRLLRWLEATAILRGLPVRRSIGDLGTRGLVLLDDAESLTPQEAAALDRLAREPGELPVRVVAAARAGELRSALLQRLLGDAGSVAGVERIDLGPLDARGIRALAERATAGEASDERVQWLLDASEGLAAAAVELLVDGRWERRETRGKIGRIAEGRWASLSPPARSWLESLAVLGGDAPFDTVARLARLERPAARQAAEEAAASGLAHGGLVDHVLSRMTASARRERNREALALVGAEADPWLRCRLLAGAGEEAKAGEAAARAAEEAQARGDPGEAAVRWGRALSLRGRSRRGRAALWLRRAEALAATGRHDRAGAAYARAARHAEGGAVRDLALARRAGALARAGRFEEAIALSGPLGEASDPLVAGHARRARGIALGRLGRETEAIPILEAALESLRSIGEADAEAEVAHALATCRLRAVDPRARGALAEAIEACARAGGREREADALKARIGLAVLEWREGRLDGAKGELERVRDEAGATGHLDLVEACLSRLSAIAIDDGRLDAAMRLAGRAVDLASRLGDPNLALVGRCNLADAKIRCGRAAEAVSDLREALAAPVARVEPENVDYARMLLVDASVESGAVPPAALEGALAEVLGRCRQRRKPRPWWMALTIEMERRAAGGGDAAALEPEFLALEAPGAAPTPEMRIRAALALSSSAGSRGDGERSRARALEARAIAAGAGYPAFEARACAALGEIGDGRRLLDRAKARIEDPAVRATFEARAVYAGLRESPAPSASGGRVEALYAMIRVLNEETDPEALLEGILDMALRTVAAERGLVLLREEREGPDAGTFTVRAARHLDDDTARDAQAYSLGIVSEAGRGRSIVALDAGSDARFRDLRSVSLLGIRSLMCVPLRSRGRILGTVYLDRRRGERAFTPEDLRFVEAFADHAGLAIENARMRQRLERQNRQLQAAAEATTSHGSLVGRSPGMRTVFSLVEKIAASELPVLIRGESGTGKDLVARALHFQGPRRRKPFLSENCAAIPESLLESELFGHVRGAFTGADRAREGLFERADGGTLFLDEVGDMPPSMQAKLLRVLEDGRVRPVGGEKSIPVDVRIVTATHRDLAAEIRAGRFRQDLLYRLQVLTIELPSLRERPGDVSLLAAFFLERIARERGKSPTPIDDAALGMLERHGWPGNVRELQNVLQRLDLLAGNRAITAELVATDPAIGRALEAGPRRAAFSLRAGERGELERALRAADGSRVKAARLLGISRATLYRKLAQHGL